MSVFKENLTSRILQKETFKLAKNSKRKLNILEIGCGNGNITKFLINNQKKLEHNYFLSDISAEAIRSAKKNINYKNIIFKKGYLYDPWEDYRFDIIISDVSSISDVVARNSEWYNGVTYDSGKNGLKNIEQIISLTNNFLSKNGIFLFPIISLCDVKKLKQLTKIKFKKIIYTKKNYWPLPKYFLRKKFLHELKKENFIEFEDKFGIYIAYTQTAICRKT